MFDSGVSRARPLAPRAGHTTGNLQQLRRSASQRAAAARAAFSHATSRACELSPDAASGLNFPTGSGSIAPRSFGAGLVPAAATLSK